MTAKLETLTSQFFRKPFFLGPWTNCDQGLNKYYKNIKRTCVFSNRPRLFLTYFTTWNPPEQLLLHHTWSHKGWSFIAVIQDKIFIGPWWWDDCPQQDNKGQNSHHVPSLCVRWSMTVDVMTVFLWWSFESCGCFLCQLVDKPHPRPLPYLSVISH